MKTIAIDVDLVLAQTDQSWLSWLEGVCDTTLREGTPSDYDLTNYFREELSKKGLTGKEFWTIPDLYSKVKPVEGAVTGCTLLKELGYRLLPVTKVYTEHVSSKRRWVKEYFPMLEDPIYISLGGSKSDIKCDYIIDDDPKNFEGFTRETKCITFKTPYYSGTPYIKGVTPLVADNWYQVFQYFHNEYLVG